MTKNKPQIEAQKRTYCPFPDGLAPDLLRVGGLYLDPMNPGGLEDRRFDYRWEEFDEREKYEEYLHKKKYCFPDDVVANFHKTFMQSSGRSFGATLTAAFNGSHSKDKWVETSLTGDAGRRIALRVPQRFLKEDVLTQPGAKEWLVDQATIIKSSLPPMFGTADPTWEAPRVWLCTGLQMVKDGSYQTGEGAAIATSLHAQADPSAAASAPPGTLAVGVNLAWSKAKGSQSSYTFEGERIWAAEFSELKVRYSSDPDLKNKNRPRVVERCEVQPIPDFGPGAVRMGADSTQHETSPVDTSCPNVIDVVMGDEFEDESDSGNVLVIDGHFADQFVGVDWDRYHVARRWLDEDPNRAKARIGEDILNGDTSAGAER